MKPTVFIHTNPKQVIGALVSAHSLRRNSTHAGEFEIRILNTVDFAFLHRRESHGYLRDGVIWHWHSNDLQSFTPLRFMPPELMGYRGRAVVIDPDVFAVADIWELLSRDMLGAAIMCRPRPGSTANREAFATSVMLLDCTKLGHWQCERQFEEMFTFERDYVDWIRLGLERRDTIAPFEASWNDLDRLTPSTKLLHNTKRRTQPWKTGLPVDFQLPEKPLGAAILGRLDQMRRSLFGEYAFLGRYGRHPDPNQERLFFGLLRECLDDGTVTEPQLCDEMRKNHVRHDAFEVLRRTPALSK